MTNFFMDIPQLEDELWWGGLVTDGINMPMGNSRIERSLCPIKTENQTMPLLISNKGRYIWSEEPFDYVFTGQSVQVSSTRAEIVFKEGYSSLKGAYQAASKSHFPPNNKLPEKLLFTMPQYNTWIELMYDQTEENILEYANNIISEGYPPGVLMIDDNWQEDYGVLKFHKRRFKDPKGMIDKLHNLGFKVMLWISPFISPDCALFRELRQKDLLVKDNKGQVAVRGWWNGYSAILDLSNPAAVNWFKKDLNRLMKNYGIDGYKFDAGDPQYYHDDDQIHTPTNAQCQCRNYSLIGMSYPLNEYRASFKVAGLPIVQRLCDKMHSWDNNGLGSLIPNGLAQNLMGYYYNCPDMIGGGQYLNFLPGNLNLDEELVVRYAQCSALFPMMQFSVAPWRVLSHENAQLCLEMAKLHMEFGEYIYDVAKSSSQTGEPIMRHMAYSYGNEYAHINDQFLIGDDILVAPVVTKETYQRTVQIPEGTWQGDDQSIVVGPCEITIDVPISRLPFFRKQK